MVPSTSSADQPVEKVVHGFTWGRSILGASIVLALVGVYWVLSETSALDALMNREILEKQIFSLGLWGPAAVIALIAVAIVMSPVPSAPIALAAGAVYGHTWGTLYILAGAEIGALIAFLIARLVGYDLLRKWFGERMYVGPLGSQNVLMALVFVSRLLPFLSFDIISYVAGLSALSFWRFALATLAGILPASFLLAHFGGELASGDMARALISVIVLGGVTLIPVAVGLYRRKISRP
ncbi:MAG: TVP38/TMEM64 family protein [Rhodospirillales bacterium]|nr:TVP38/TMEM64 family protein [Rhodospirillales bacterium]